MPSSDSPRNIGSTLRSLARRWMAISTRQGRLRSSAMRSSSSTSETSLMPLPTIPRVSSSPAPAVPERSVLGSLMRRTNASKCAGEMARRMEMLTIPLRVKASRSLGTKSSAMPAPTRVRTLTGSSSTPVIRMSVRSRVSRLVMVISAPPGRELQKAS